MLAQGEIEHGVPVVAMPDPLGVTAGFERGSDDGRCDTVAQEQTGRLPRCTLLVYRPSPIAPLAC